MLLGISIWYILAPEQLFLNPSALVYPTKIKYISSVLTDTYVYKYVHRIPV